MHFGIAHYCADTGLMLSEQLQKGCLFAYLKLSHWDQAE